MLAFANSYTSGTSNAQSSGPIVATVGSKTRVATPKPTLASDALPKGWMQWASNRLNDIAKLGPDWDSYGGDPPSARAISNARALLQTVYETFDSLVHEQSQPQIVAPRADGGIQIEWSTPPVEIAVHADPSGTMGYLSIDRHGDRTAYREVQSASWNDILQLIAAVVFTVPR